MDSRKRRTARSRSFSREKEDFSNLDIPIGRSEKHRGNAATEYGRMEDYGREEAYHHERRGKGKKRKKNPLKGLLVLFLLLIASFFFGALSLLTLGKNIVPLPYSAWTVEREIKRREPCPM